MYGQALECKAWRYLCDLPNVNVQKQSSLYSMQFILVERSVSIVCCSSQYLFTEQFPHVYNPRCMDSWLLSLTGWYGVYGNGCV